MPWDSVFGRDAFGEDDESAPQVLNIDPPDGTPIDTDQIITLDLRDGAYVSGSSLVVTMTGGSELIWDGSVFTSRFAPLSSVTSTETEADGHTLHFALRRTGGWYSAPTFTAVATDPGENEAT